MSFVALLRRLIFISSNNNKRNIKDSKKINASGLPDGIHETCVKRGGLCDGRSRWWQAKARIVVTILICVFVSAMIIYWFVSSIMENRRDGRHRGSSGGKSRKTAHLERLPDHILPLEYT